LQFGAGLQPDSGLGEGLDVVGDYGCAAVADGGEQIAVGNQAHPLIPRVVRRREMGVDRVALWQLLDRGLAQHRLHRLGAAAAQVEDRDCL
jgi:hypothetical protein